MSPRLPLVIFEDRFTVQAPVEKVWAFLRDPQQVAQCIPGAERIEVIDDRHYHVVAGARVSFRAPGRVAARQPLLQQRLSSCRGVSHPRSCQTTA